MTKYFFYYFQIFSIFTYKKSSMRKSYQFSRFYKIFYKKREETLIQQSMRIEKLGKVGLSFITGCFINPFKMIIIFSSIALLGHKIFVFIRKLVRSAFFAFWYQDDAKKSDMKIENGELLGIANYNICFKNNLSLLIMNVTQINFLDWQNAYI